MTQNSVENVYDLAEQALAVMRTHNLKPSPECYTVWFEYYAKSNPDLVKTVDIILSNHRNIDDEAIHNLYKKFFTFEQEGTGFLTAAQKTDDVLAELKNYLTSYNDETVNYGQVLLRASEKLIKDSSSDALKEIVANMASSTKNIQDQNKNLQNQLEKSQSEIIQLKQNLDSLKIEATTDGLTGLANRKFFNATLLKNMTESLEKGNVLSLLMIDIDHFKKFNDTYGHTVGDQVIRLVAQTLGKHARGKGLPARYGGEEFSIIMPSITSEEAINLANDIREAMSSKSIQNKKSGETLGQVTLSIGVAEFLPGETIVNFVDRADEALYSAKKSGRNRVMKAAS